jgi:phage terminase Nu1 subunit (DNA packaging protein)
MTDVSIEQLAGLLDLSSTAVTSHARRGILVRSTEKGQRGKFMLEQSVCSYCRHLREQASGRKAGDAPAADRARLVKAQAASVEQKTAIREARLLDAEAVAAEWIGICRVLRSGVLRIPKRAGNRAGLTQDQIGIVDAEVRAVLAEISKDEAPDG